jgi:hypothetical protein
MFAGEVFVVVGGVAGECRDILLCIPLTVKLAYGPVSGRADLGIPFSLYTVITFLFRIVTVLDVKPTRPSLGLLLELKDASVIPMALNEVKIEPCWIATAISAISALQQMHL